MVHVGYGHRFLVWFLAIHGKRHGDSLDRSPHRDIAQIDDCFVGGLTTSRKVINETGKRYGRLVVLAHAKVDKPGAYWLCKCNCGNEVVVHGASLRKGSTRSCDCLQKERARERGIDLTGQRFHRLVAHAIA